VPDSYRAPSGGPTHGIEDQIVAKEIRRLWDAINARATGPDSAKYVTIDQLNAAKREVLGKFTSNEVKGFRQDIGGSSANSVSTGGGDDLLPRNNTWTGTNWYTRKTAANVPTMRLQSYNSGTIAPGAGIPTIMLETGYQAVIDVRKTTSANGDAISGGGTAGIYVQHRVDATTTPRNNVNSGIRVQMESWQRTIPGLVNDVVSGYFGLLNHGVDSGGFGTHVDAYHWGSGQTVTYGASVELYRAFLDGKVIGYHCRQAGFGDYTQESDYGFLASPQTPGNGIGIKTIFSGGSDYTGHLRCDVGLDLAYATCSSAAIRVPGSTRIQLNGTANNVGLYFDPAGKIRFFSNIGNTVSIGNDGSVRVRGGSGYVELADDSLSSVKLGYGSSTVYININSQTLYEFHANGTFGIMNPETTAGAGRQWGYFVINLGGFLRKVPFYAMS
jgi:hypothetical protein